MNILVVGGDSDPNLSALLATLEKRGLEYKALLVGQQYHPRVTWDINEDILYLNGEASSPKAVFIRHDIFTHLATKRPATAQRAYSWFTTLSGWVYAHPEVRIFNRDNALKVTNKPQVLHLAKKLGLTVPSTLLSNDVTLLMQEMKKGPLIVKPVNGGDFAQELAGVLQKAPIIKNSLAAPALVQEQLVPPEIRIYGIDCQFFVYKLVADALDYRSTSDCQVIPLSVSDVPEGLLDRLAALMRELQMDFCAADFKACPQTGELKFLEINNSPMFVAFDAVSEGRLIGAFVDFLNGTN
ncbi:MAG: hypothetical protein J7647_08115 [Cyanobacteria bacterium SBLK]|nr:hypothetical protein [Cyanobacteria bacterium SBLK]